MQPEPATQPATHTSSGPAPPPFVSVILPVLNEANSLPDTLAQLLDQQYPPDRYEILVADGGSTDGTPELVRAAAASARTLIRLVPNPGMRSGPGRNAGLLASRGELIVFIDGHCELPSRMLLAHTAEIFAATGAACLCRPQPLLAAPATPTGRMVAAVRASWLGHGRDSLIYNLEHAGFVDPASSGASYRREVFATVGLYDESFDACEDVEFNTRVRQAGYRAYTDPRLAVYYQPRGSVGSLWRQMVRYGRGRAKLMRKHPQTCSLAALAPLVLAGCLLVSPLAMAASLRAILMRTALSTGGLLPGALPQLMLGLLAALPLVGFAAGVAVCSVQLAARVGARALWQAPILFVAIYGGLAAGMATGFGESSSAGNLAKSWSPS